MGCGHGVLVSLLATQLSTGFVVGVDRSATMVAAATRRNRAELDRGRVRLQATTLADADLADAEFDLVASFNVRAFWTPPGLEWDVVARALTPAGRVLVAFSLMEADLLARVEDCVRRQAGERGLVVTEVHQGATKPFPSAAIDLRRSA